MKRILAALIVAILAANLNAAVLNWYNDVDYAAGSLNQTFNNIDGSGVNVNFAWSGNTNRILAGLPDDDAAKTNFDMSALWYAANFAAYPSEGVSVTITFSEPVYGVNFTLYDIDGETPMIEKTRIKGFLAGVPTLPDSYDCGNNVLIEIIPVDTDPSTEDGFIFWNDGYIDYSPPNALSQGWVTFDGPIDMIGLQFKAGAGADRGQLMGDITFVPEPATISMLGLGVLGLLRRRK
jgi:hypothetical protein